MVPCSLLCSQRLLEFSSFFEETYITLFCLPLKFVPQHDKRTEYKILPTIYSDAKALSDFTNILRGNTTLSLINFVRPLGDTILFVILLYYI